LYTYNEPHVTLRDQGEENQFISKSNQINPASSLAKRKKKRKKTSKSQISLPLPIPPNTSSAQKIRSRTYHHHTNPSIKEPQIQERERKKRRNRNSSDIEETAKRKKGGRAVSHEKQAAKDISSLFPLVSQ
jgi:hypothetical protein